MSENSLKQSLIIDYKNDKEYCGYFSINELNIGLIKFDKKFIYKSDNGYDFDKFGKTVKISDLIIGEEEFNQMKHWAHSGDDSWIREMIKNKRLIAWGLDMKITVLRDKSHFELKYE